MTMLDSIESTISLSIFTTSDAQQEFDHEYIYKKYELFIPNVQSLTN